MLVVFIGAHLPSVVVVLGMQKAELGFQITLFIMRCSALAWGVYNEDPRVTVAAYSFVSATLILGYSTWLLKRAGNHITITGAVFFKELIVAAMLVLPATLGLRLLAGLCQLLCVVVSVFLIAWFLVRRLEVNQGNSRCK